MWEYKKKKEKNLQGTFFAVVKWNQDWFDILFFLDKDKQAENMKQRDLQLLYKNIIHFPLTQTLYLPRDVNGGKDNI